MVNVNISHRNYLSPLKTFYGKNLQLINLYTGLTGNKYIKSNFKVKVHLK